jgi:hypothetical protein
MQFRTAATLVAAAILLQACECLHHGGGPGGGDGGYPGPPSKEPPQHLVPIQIVGATMKVPPYPSDRFSIALCDQAKCNFTVTVQGDCQISLDPQYMAVSRNQHIVTLVYTLEAPAGFTLAEIRDKPRNPHDPSPFEPGSGAGSTVLQVAFRNNPAHGREYGVVVLKNGTECGVLDPGVIPDY